MFNNPCLISSCLGSDPGKDYGTAAYVDIVNTSLDDPEQLTFTNWAATSPAGKDCITVSVGEVRPAVNPFRYYCS